MFYKSFIISSFNLATLQQFFKKRQNRRYYHFNVKQITERDFFKSANFTENGVQFKEKEKNRVYMKVYAKKL